MNKYFPPAVSFLIIFTMFMGCPETASSSPVWIYFERGESWQPGDPVPANYLDTINETDCTVRMVSRYFCAVSVEWEGDVDALRELEGVRSVETVKQFTKAPEPESPPLRSVEKPTETIGDHMLDYGVSYRQLNVLNIPALHDMGLTGEGVVIGVLDTGFIYEGTGCLTDVNVTHMRNFITGEDGPGTETHGVHVLGCLAGARPGSYYGAAFGAEYLLASTDDEDTETRADEDRWVAAVEWCDSLGADMISSSLVYNIFDSLTDSYAKNDMDGKTSLVAQAAEIAWSRGILMVNSVGNEGTNSWRIVTTPADAEHVLAVGAVSYPESGETPVADFSSRGPTADGRIKPDVAAPGSMVYLPAPGYDNYYFPTNGTSYAAPLVAGLCALLMEAHPEWTAADVVTALKETATDKGAAGPDNDYGWGIPNGVAALEFTPVSVESDARAGNSAIITPFSLLAPFPNPFNAEITISYRLDRETAVAIDIMDVTGRRVKRLYDGLSGPGIHHVTWNGAGQASGVYFARAAGKTFSEQRKLLLVK